MRIVFFTSSSFAKPILKAILQAKHEVVSLVSTERGSSIILDFAKEKNIDILYTHKLHDPLFLESLKNLKADLFVVVAFRILPEKITAIPPKGAINLHTSLLPKYRGAAPIQWALIHGEKETGITTFFLKNRVDRGDIILKKKVTISKEDNFQTLSEKLSQQGASLMLQTLELIENGNYILEKQPEELPYPLPKAPKILTSTCKIDFSKTALQVFNFVRGLYENPTAWTYIRGKKVKLFKVSVEKKKIYSHYLTDEKNYLFIKTADFCVSVEEIQLEGKKRMDIKEFLKGNKLFH